MADTDIVMADAGPRHPFFSLPLELRDMIWQETVGLDGGPMIQCFEVDFLEGLEGLEPEPAAWFTFPHVPALYTASKQLGGQSTTGVSTYDTVRRVMQSCNQASNAISRFHGALCRNPPEKVVELKAKAPLAASGFQDVSVWMNTEKDLICLQGPSTKLTREFRWDDDYTRVSWFCKRYHWWVKPTFTFRPLPLFSLDRFEHVAIDWNCEVGRQTIVPDCDDGACLTLKWAYYAGVYRTPGKDRKYCSRCLGDVLNRPSWSATDPFGDFSDAFYEQFIDAFYVLYTPDGFTYVGEPPLGLDEPGSFLCVECGKHEPSVEGRVQSMIDKEPNENTLNCLGWAPKCRQRHRPSISSDIDTFVMGRLPALKTFYIIETNIKLKPGKQPTLPHEAFAGHNCKFVEVDENDDAWDLSEYSEHGGPTPWVHEFHAFGYADRLRWLVWVHATRQHTQSLLDQEAKEMGIYVSKKDIIDENGTKVPLHRRPLDRVIWGTDSNDDEVWEIEYPIMPPAHLLPVQVKVLTRIDN